MAKAYIWYIWDIPVSQQHCRYTAVQSNVILYRVGCIIRAHRNRGHARDQILHLCIVMLYAALTWCISLYACNRHCIGNDTVYNEAPDMVLDHRGLDDSPLGVLREQEVELLFSDLNHVLRPERMGWIFWCQQCAM